MKKTSELIGTIYKNGSRWWYKVKLPGESASKSRPLIPIGAKFATKDRKTADLVAAQMWRRALEQSKPQIDFDGKISSLVNMYHQRNLSYYLPPSREAANIKYAIFPLAQFFPNLLADDFTPLHLQEFRDQLITQLSRKLINARINHIKRMFKWAASQMMISSQTYLALTTVDGLRQGRSVARESKKVLPAPSQAVNAVIAYATDVIADMIRIQLLTGMRPGELCKMRPCDIDRTGEIWIYSPTRTHGGEYAHKTEWLGHKKQIAIGPKAQQILTKYLFRSADKYCFTPEESSHQARLRRTSARKTPMSCGNKPGSNKKNTETFNPCFDTKSYRKHIVRIAKFIKVTPWSPHQLRHSKATEIRSNNQFVPDDILATLGQRTQSMVDVYAELSFERAKRVAKITG